MSVYQTKPKTKKKKKKIVNMMRFSCDIVFLSTHLCLNLFNLSSYDNLYIK